MANAVRDDNQIRAVLGSYSGTPTLLKADHATGRLKIKYIYVSSLPTTTRTESNRDDNNVPTAMLTGLSTTLPTPALADHTNGALRISSN